MSPEQAAGVPSGEPSDWYAVGVMLYQALTGLLPFRGEFLDVLRRKQLEVPAAPSSLVAGVSPGLDRLCMKLLERNPATRGS
jgi:serine/threonine protein kinase